MATVKREDGRSARMPAAERREAILEAAMAEFALGGLHGTATEDIARRAGITQPYVFRLFGTKKALYLETIERCFDRVQRAFEVAAAAAEPSEKLQAMARAYGPLLLDRSLLLGQMHSYADCSDPDVQAVVRRRYGELWEWVERASGAAPRGGAGVLLEGHAPERDRGDRSPRAERSLGGGVPGRARSRRLTTPFFICELRKH